MAPTPTHRYTIPNKMSSKLFRHTKGPRRDYFPLETIIGELLCVILEHVYENEDLLNVCLVCRRLYMFAMEKLYRDISLDVTLASHRQLVQRVICTNSVLLQRIQSIRITGALKPYDKHYSELRLLILRHKNPRKIVLDGLLCVSASSGSFLDAIHDRFPHAAIEIDTISQLTQYVEYTATTLTSHPICFQITQLSITLEYGWSEYADFKKDLISVLRRAKSLEDLTIRTSEYDSFPEYLAAFRTDKLPKLKRLDLGREKGIFTSRELELWGRGDKLERLTLLLVGSAVCFGAIIKGKVDLKLLYLYTHEARDMADIVLALERRASSSPFENLHHFSCVEQTAHGRYNFVFMNVDVLRWTPNLKSIVVGRDYHVSASYLPPGFNLPTLQQIKDMRRLCPDLEEILIEVGIAGSTTKWPLDAIDELCRFEKLTYLNLFVCNHPAQVARIRNLDYRIMAGKILDKRQ